MDCCAQLTHPKLTHPKTLEKCAKMPLSNMCYSPTITFTRRGLNRDLTTTRSGAAGSLVFFNDPAEIGFNPDTHILLYKVQAVTAVLGSDRTAGVDQSIWLLLGDAALKGAKTFPMGVHGDGEDEAAVAPEEIIDFMRVEAPLSVHHITGRKGEAYQVQTQPGQCWLPYERSLKNVGMIVRECQSGKLIDADITAKISFKSKTIASNE